jgi:hypothetical protein
MWQLNGFGWLRVFEIGVTHARGRGNGRHEKKYLRNNPRGDVDFWGDLDTIDDVL